MNTVTEAALKQMPPGKCVGFVQTRDMSNDLRNAVIWIHEQMLEGGYRDCRKSFFDPVTGEYLGEAA